MADGLVLDTSHVPSIYTCLCVFEDSYRFADAILFHTLAKQIDCLGSAFEFQKHINNESSLCMNVACKMRPFPRTGNSLC